MGSVIASSADSTDSSSSGSLVGAAVGAGVFGASSAFVSPSSLAPTFDDDFDGAADSGADNFYNFPSDDDYDYASPPAAAGK